MGTNIEATHPHRVQFPLYASVEEAPDSPNQSEYVEKKSPAAPIAAPSVQPNDRFWQAHPLEPPFVRVLRDAVVRYLYQRATRPVYTEILQENLNPLVDPLDNIVIEKLPSQPPPDFSAFDREHRGQYLRERVTEPLPDVVAIDDLNNSVTIRYQGEELIFHVGFPPSWEQDHGMGHQRSVDHFFLKSFSLYVRFQRDPCFEDDLSDAPVHDLEELLQTLKDLIQFVQDLRTGDTMIMFRREAVYLSDTRELRFYGKREGSDNERYVYHARTRQVPPLDVPFLDELTSDIFECAPFLKNSDQQLFDPRSGSVMR